MRRCLICDGYHVDWWRTTLTYHVFKTVKLAILIVRKPWQGKSDEPFDNIDWPLAWDVSRGIHWKRGTN